MTSKGASERRAAIVTLLEAQPGLTFRGIMRETGVPAGTVRHHLNVLIRQKRIWYQQIGVRLLHFAGHRPETEADQREALCATFDEIDASLYLAVGAHAPVCQGDIMDAFPDQPRSTTQHRLKRLARLGILVERPQGRFRFYHVPE